MNLPLSGLSKLLILALCMGSFACANIKPPEGGPKDEIGPVPIKVTPADQSLNFSEKKIEIRFNEYLKPGGYGDQVFISPVMDVPPGVTVRGKKLTIQLEDSLRDSTTYVVTISTGIKDFTENNEMASPIIYAFSTGEVIDSLEIKGSVKNALTGKAEKNVVLMLFPADEVAEDSIYGKKPVYASITDENGKFGLFYLARGKYKLYAVKDADKSFTWNQPNEAIAIAEQPEVDFGDTLLNLSRDLLLFTPDQEAPVPSSARWAGKFMVVDFKEKIPEEIFNESVKYWLTDTLGQDSSSLEQAIPFPGKNTKYFFPATNDSLIHHIQFRNLVDTLGNSRDTFIRIYPDALQKELKAQLYLEPNINLKESSLDWLVHGGIISSDAKVQIRDTSGTVWDSEQQMSDYQITMTFDSFPDPAKGPWQLAVDSGFTFANDSVLDTILTFDLKFPKKGDLATLSGKVVDTSWTGDWVVLLKDDKGKVVRRTGETFSYSNLPSGKYTFELILDEDGNQYWSPGSILPYRQPEKIWRDPKPVDVRPGWEISDYFVIPIEGTSDLSPSEINKKKK